MMPKINVTKRADGFSAEVAGRPELSGFGRSLDEAVGNLINTHRLKFGIEIITAD